MMMESLEDRRHLSVTTYTFGSYSLTVDKTGASVNASLSQGTTVVGTASGTLSGSTLTGSYSFSLGGRTFSGSGTIQV
jgi:hemolysin activation/secretion protein